MPQKPNSLLIAAKIATQTVQRRFEQAVWEVGFVLQKSAGLSGFGAQRGENVEDIIQVLKKVMTIAREAIKQDTTLHWTRNPTFDWQQNLENLRWIPPRVLAECKANFAWFSANVRVSTGKGDIDSPGFSKFGPPRKNVTSSYGDYERLGGQNANVKVEHEDKVFSSRKSHPQPFGRSIDAPILLSDSDDEQDELASDMEREGDSESDASQWTPRNHSKHVKNIIGAKARYERNVAHPPKSTAVKPLRKRKLLIFDPKLHERITPKCARCSCTNSLYPKGRDCFTSISQSSRTRKTCNSCYSSHLRCTLYLRRVD
ncbi:hypothetical protein HYPSUDRAFT_37680 [Hypholoma sublateritium FD-334 SS-4]|uniref:Uncharacterized protein n=1 Tax=Hypholoma sublateritium (strain FD-334 SS-4) TaxID=945553 RepID=A0A0D2P446_HYPSF|nr:hypothetical protein HYPSUDRAFT_37680 [Hypholoma sublateritium FD-334 SS-4]